MNSWQILIVSIVELRKQIIFADFLRSDCFPGTNCTIILQNFPPDCLQIFSALRYKYVILNHTSQRILINILEVRLYAFKEGKVHVPMSVCLLGSRRDSTVPARIPKTCFCTCTRAGRPLRVWRGPNGIREDRRTLLGLSGIAWEHYRGFQVSPENTTGAFRYHRRTLLGFQVARDHASYILYKDTKPYLGIPFKAGSRWTLRQVSAVFFLSPWHEINV